MFNRAYMSAEIDQVVASARMALAVIDTDEAAREFTDKLLEAIGDIVLETAALQQPETVN